MTHAEAIRRLLEGLAASAPILQSLRYDLASPFAEDLQAAIDALHLNIGARSPETPDERRRTRALNAFGHVKDGLAAVQYHRDEAARLEGEITALCHSHAESLGAAAGVTTAFRCLPLGFHYQAFVFAERRTLEYLAVSVASYFGRECHRIKRLSQSIKDAEPAIARERIVARLVHDLPALGLSADEHRSVRDRLAHWEAIDAGILNVTPLPDGSLSVRLVGGGEDLDPNPWRAGQSATLVSALDARVRRLQEFVLGAVRDLSVATG